MCALPDNLNIKYRHNLLNTDTIFTKGKLWRI